jgi:hypothetical protein
VVTVVISLTASLIREYQVGEINRSVTNQIELTFVAPAAMYCSTSSSATARRWPVGASSSTVAQEKDAAIVRAFLRRPSCSRAMDGA